MSRRLEIDRRQFSYTIHIPERRSGKDRRSGNDSKLEVENKINNREHLNWQDQ
jgi:hypothetical protein